MKYIDTKYLWHSDWYDGPLEGACEYNGRIYWFAIYDRIKYIHDRSIIEKDTFKVYYISDEDIEHQTYWHDFEDKIDNISNSYYTIAKKYFNHLYKLGRKDPNIDESNPIGFTHF